MFDTLVLASNNAGKLKEFSALLARLGITVKPQGELNVPECPEPHFTFLENALEKARHASRVTGLPAPPVIPAWKLVHVCDAVGVALAAAYQPGKQVTLALARGRR